MKYLQVIALKRFVYKCVRIMWKVRRTIIRHDANIAFEYHWWFLAVILEKTNIEAKRVGKISVRWFAWGVFVFILLIIQPIFDPLII